MDEKSGHKEYQKYLQEILEIDAQLFLLNELTPNVPKDASETITYINEKTISLVYLRKVLSESLNQVRMELARRHLDDAGMDYTFSKLLPTLSKSEISDGIKFAMED